MVKQSDSSVKKSGDFPEKEGIRDRATALGLAAFFFGMLVSLTMREKSNVLLSAAAVCLSIAAPLALSSVGIAGLQLSEKAYTEKSNRFQTNMTIGAGIIGFIGIALVLYEYHWLVALTFAVATAIAYVLAQKACNDLIQHKKEEKT